MNYNDMISKSGKDNQYVGKCIHNTIKEQCNFCNGLYDKQQQEQQKYKLELEERRQLSIKRETLQEESKEFASNNEKEWTDEELKYTIANTSGKERRDIDVLYAIAKYLKRTLYSIEFIFCYAWELQQRTYWEKDNKNILDRIDVIKTQLGV